MNIIDDDILQAYVDGELDAAGAAQVDAALADNDVLARRLQQMRALRAQLQAAFGPVLDEPVPDRLTALLQPTAALVAPAVGATRTRGFGAGRRGASRRWFMPGIGVAASLAALTAALWWHAGSGPVRVHDGRTFAAGGLSEALDHALASQPDAHASIRIGISFRSADGHICRTFVDRTLPASSGLACHDDGGWSLAVFGAAEDREGGQMRQAASALSPAVQAAVDARIRGDAFDVRQERAARDAGWR
jgi:hypothetical protein